MLPVAAELVRRGNRVRFYSFAEFSEKIRATGADFCACDAFLPKLTAQQAKKLARVSTTEMTLQDIRTTRAMDSFLDAEYADFLPDAVYCDAVCFWGKLSAAKHGVPLVISTSTFAFNQLSAQYMRHSPRELCDLIFGLPKISKELKSLAPLGYRFKGALALVQSDNQTDNVVYTSRTFQPYAESFSAHYAFVGPSVFSKTPPNKQNPRPLVYISMGTVLHDRPDFYQTCIRALRDEPVDVMISCGSKVDPETLAAPNVKAYPRVDQLEILSKADVFLTHCGMNSVSESLYMGCPMVLYPQTGEQQAVARRTKELGAGALLTDDTADGIRAAVREILKSPSYAAAASACSRDLRACGGAAAAADFLESAPLTVSEPDILAQLNKKTAVFRLLYWLCAFLLMAAFGLVLGWGRVWYAGVLLGILSEPIARAAQKRIYTRLLQNRAEQNG